MNRKKKEWMKAAHARQKAARLARRGSADVADSALDEAAASVNLAVGEPVSQPAVEDRSAEAVALARGGLDEARALFDEAGELGDDEAREMLVGAARMLNEVIETTHAALRSVPETWRREAASTLAAGPEASDLPPVKRPRRGPDPVVTLMKVGMQAASLLKRIIGKTNPNLGKLRRAA